MRNFWPLFILFCLCVPVVADDISFNRDIRPILSDKCFACHGFDAKHRKASLRLDIGEGDEGAFTTKAIVPGDVEASEAWHRILSTDPDEIMPPPETHKVITIEERETLRKWIEAGATYEEHWAFIAPEKPELPEEKSDNPIDAFLQARLTKEGLSPGKRAEKETLIRRVTLDLTGLPPTIEEVKAFQSDSSPTAYEKLVDDLQSRVTYGEHMARYWLDLARYADTHGLHLDNERSMWPYRDWVVRALNDNLAFDEFTRWQIAGDLLPEPTIDQKIASGFNRCNVTTSEGGSINNELIFRYAVDRTSTMSEVWMGLTAGCAVCHDHKFDPLSAKEFYEMYAFFYSAADPAMDGNRIDTPPVMKIITDEDRQKTAEFVKQIEAADGDINKAVASILASYNDPAALEDRPKATTNEVVWFEDAFPEGGKTSAGPGGLNLTTKDKGPVFSGDVAIRRTAHGLQQDFCQNTPPITVPVGADVFVHAYLDPENPPETIMIQYHTDGWKHRAVWGAEAKIPWGRAGTTEKVLKGNLPETGKWVRLQLPAKEMGLNGAKAVNGFAFTQYGGTMSWDRMGVVTVSNPAEDPSWSWSSWAAQDVGERNKLLDKHLADKLKERPPDKWTAEETKTVKTLWVKKMYQGARDILSPLEGKKANLVADKKKLENSFPVTMVMADLPRQRKSFVMERGAYDSPGEQVFRATPAFLPDLPERKKDEELNRRHLAEWLIDGSHPLTARVTVNRFWQQFFGKGLVSTSADFGSQGEPPSHPDLLDWLAVTFVEDGWDMKKLVKRIVTSDAYCQDAKVSPELLERDPDNRLLARGPRLRLDAEVIRDQVLFVSGLLVDKVGGKGVRPYQPPNIWEPVGFGSSNTRYYKRGTGDDLYRRSLYTFFKRTAPPPFMSSFDAPNREASCSARGRSNTPLQALQLMNDIQHVEAARNLAQRMHQEGGDTAKQRIVWGWRAIMARVPSDAEAAIVEESLAGFKARYAEDDAAAKELISFGESPVDTNIPPADLAGYTMIANLMLNLDEVVNR